MAGSQVTDATKSGMKRDVVVTRIFDAPIEQVWQAWVEPDLVMQWWGPTGFTSPLANMDFHEGGTSLVCMRAPKEFGGQDMYSTWTYTKIVPNERIEYIFRFADQEGNTLDPADMGMEPGIPKEGHHVVTFQTVGNNRTEMTVTEYGYESDQAHDLSKGGLEQCLDKMAGIFAKA
jgi:uncharacterized protein YndB with AHSA1/START domain